MCLSDPIRAPEAHGCASCCLRFWPDKLLASLTPTRCSQTSENMKPGLRCCRVAGALSRLMSRFAPSIRKRSTWSDAGRSEILHVNFEELKQKPQEQLGRIVTFLQMPEVMGRIPGAIENNSLARMKEKEKANPQRASAKGRFIRSGSAGGWKSTFTDRQSQLMQQYAGSLMARLGYSAVESLEGQFA